MKQQFEATLSGPDTLVDGVVNKVNFDGFEDAYEFESIDNSYHLVIAKDENGNWIRLAGTDPYLSGWIGELAQQIR